MSINVAIIGAGLGGLACAIALQRQGIKVQVYAQAWDFRPIGGGLGLFPNGLHFLELIEPEIVTSIKNAGCCVQKIVRKNIAGETLISPMRAGSPDRSGQGGIATIFVVEGQLKVKIGSRLIIYPDSTIYTNIEEQELSPAIAQDMITAEHRRNSTVPLV